MEKHWSEGVTKLVVWLSGMADFETAAEIMEQAGQVQISDSSVWRRTEKWGERICEIEEAEREKANAVPQRWERPIGRGNRASPYMAGPKFQVCLNLSTGELRGPVLQDGRTHDRCSPFQRAPLLAGALRIADLGFFTLDVLKSIADQGAYWISRLQAQAIVYDDKGHQQERARLLKSQRTHEVDIQVSIGQAHRLPCRLVARRVSQEVADARRRKLHSEARRRRQVGGAARLPLAEWTVYVRTYL